MLHKIAIKLLTELSNKGFIDNDKWELINNEHIDNGDNSAILFYKATFQSQLSYDIFEVNYNKIFDGNGGSRITIQNIIEKEDIPYGEEK